MAGNSLIEVCVDILHETSAAFLVSDGVTETWIPKSQINDADDYHLGEHGVTMEIPEWLAEDKELI